MNSRMQIVLSQNNRWDYEEFCSLCEESHVQRLGLSEWAQKVGLLTAAQEMYKNLPPGDAYAKLLESANAEIHGSAIMRPKANPATSAYQNIKSPGCGTCGGGAVR